MLTIKAGDRGITNTNIVVKLGNTLDRLYRKLPKGQLPELCIRILDEVDQCDVLSGAIFVNRDTDDTLNFHTISNSCKTLLALVLDTEGEYWFTDAYCGIELIEQWLPEISLVSNSNLLLELYSLPDEFPDYSKVYSWKRQRAYNNIIEILQDVDKYEEEFSEEIEDREVGSGIF